MKKRVLIPALFFAGVAFAQNSTIFNNAAALQEAQQKGLSPADHAGYVSHKYKEWQVANGLVPAATQQPSFKNGSGVFNTLQSASNIDFETGDYTGWQLYVGDNDMNSFGSLSNVVPSVAGLSDTLQIDTYYSYMGTNTCDMIDASMRHGLMTPAIGSDPLTGIPLASPLGGNYVARVGRFCRYYEASVLEQTFNVTAGQQVLNYAYALVLEDGGHSAVVGEQAYFRFSVLDSAGVDIPGTAIYIQSDNGTTPGFYPSIYQVAPDGIYYKPWTPVSVDLSAYVGQNVTVRVTTAGCIYDGHSGYAYFDARMDSTGNVANVWPGDANYDLTADLNDLIYIAWANGATGPARTGATNNWNAEPSADWGQKTVYGTEYKHADCNGDGVIDLNDTLAVFLNSGSTHVFKNSPSSPTLQSVSNYRNITLSSSTQAIGPNQQFSVDMYLPANSTNSNSIFGITFRVYVPTQYISQFVGASFNASAMGIQGSNLLAKAIYRASAGYVEVCLVRTDKQSSNAIGKLGTLVFKANAFTNSGASSFGVGNVKAMRYNGQYLPIGGNGITPQFNVALGVNEIASSDLLLAPNPTADYISIVGLDEAANTYEISNVVGQKIASGTVKGSETINVSALEKGTYILKLYAASNNEMRINRFVKK
ncbi:MAG: T9SS type A sorting domain-containing protein [Bacteroidetes bacterium]|nr:T9SS type A sorting domain-containing protein [Bacteroidota bacterium]